MDYFFPFEECLALGIFRVYIFGAGIIGSNFQEQVGKQEKIVNLRFLDNYITTETATGIVNRVGIIGLMYFKRVMVDMMVLF
jgi:hypothetical protein